MRDFYESVYGTYQTPPNFQGQDPSKKSRSSGSNGNVFGRFLKLGKSKSDANGYNVKSRNKPPTQQYDLEEDFRVTSTSKSPVERMVYKVNNRKDMSKSHSWIYGSVKLPSDLPFGYSHGYSPGSPGCSSQNMHSSRCQTMDYCGMCECSSEFNFHPEAPPHPHPGGIPFENNNCHACHTPNYTVNDCCKHSQVYNGQKQYAGNVDNSKKFASSVRKLTWKSLKQVVKKRPTLDVLKRSNPRAPVSPLNVLKEEPVCTHEGLLRSNYFFPDKKSFYASCTDVYGDSPQHVTASVRVRPKRSRQPWPFPNEFGPVPNYQEEEIYHSEWDLRQFLPYDVWLAASNNPYLSPNSASISTKNPKTNRHSSDQSPLAITDGAVPSASVSPYMGEEGSSTCNNYPTKSKSIGSGSIIYGSCQSSVMRSSILQTDVTAYQLIKPKKPLPSKNPLGENNDDPTDSDELSDNVVSEDPVRIGGQGIYMISGIQPSPALSTAKSLSSVHSQSNESNEKSQIKAIGGNSRKIQDGARSDVSWKMDLRGSPQLQQMSPHSIKNVPSGSREREQTADKFNNKITEPIDSTSQTVVKTNNGNAVSAKTGLKTYYSQPVGSHGVQYGAGNANSTYISNVNTVQPMKFSSPRAIVSGPNYENQVTSDSNAGSENRQSYLSEFEVFEFQDTIPNVNSTSYSSPSPSKETTAARSSQPEREEKKNLKASNNSYTNSVNRHSSGMKPYLDCGHQEPDDWSSIGEDPTPIYREGGSASQNSSNNPGDVGHNGKKNGDNNRRGNADHNGRGGGDFSGNGSSQSVGKRKKLRPGQGKSKTVLKETIYEEDSENSDEWSLHQSKQQVYAVKIVVSQNVASEYVKPILKKDRVYETPSVDSRPGQSCPQLPHKTTGSCHTNTGSDICGEGQVNTAPPTRSTKKVQFDSTRLVVLADDGDHEEEIESDNTSAKDSAEDKQDDWIVEEDYLPSNILENKKKQQQQNHEELKFQPSPNESKRDFQEPSRDYPPERRSNPAKTTNSKFSNVGFELPDTAESYGEQVGSHVVSNADYKSGHNSTKTKDKIPDSILKQSSDSQMRDVGKQMHHDERMEKRSETGQESINVQQGTNVTPVTVPLNEHRTSTPPDRETVRVTAPALQQRVLNLNSLLFHDTTRIRLNQSRPSLEQAFNFNQTPLGADRNLQGTRGKFMPRLKQSSSFRQPGGSLLRPREPPPPPPIPLRDTSLPSYRDPNGTNNRRVNPTELHKPPSYATGRPVGKAVKQDRYLAGISGEVSRQNGSSHIRKPSVSLGNTAHPLRAMNPTEISNNVSSPTRTNPNSGNVRSTYEAPRISSKEISSSRSKSLADRCKSLEKLISQRSFRLSQEEKQISSNEIARPNIQKVKEVSKTPAAVRMPLPPVPTMVDSKNKDTKTSVNSISEETKPNSVMRSGANNSTQGSSYHSHQYNFETPRDTSKKCKNETCAMQGQIPSKSSSPLQKDSQNNAKYHHPEQNIEIVTKENSVSEIRIYSTPQNINVSHNNTSTETYSTYNQSRAKDSQDNKIEEIHYAATDLLYPRGQSDQKVDRTDFEETNSSSKSRPQSTSVVLIIPPKQSLPEGTTENPSATDPQQTIYKRTDFEQRETQSDSQSPARTAMAPSSGGTPVITKTVGDVPSSDLRQHQDKTRTDVKTANSTVANSNKNNHTSTSASNASSVNSNSVETTQSTNVTSTTSSSTQSNSNVSISAESKTAKLEKKESFSEDNSEPLYDDVITYAARKAKRTAAEKRYSTFSAPQLFESLNKELTRNAATFTQNLLSKYSSKSLSSGELAQPQIQHPLPPPPIPNLPPPKNILGKIGSGSIKSRRSVSEYPSTTNSTTSSGGSQQYGQTNHQVNNNVYNDIEQRDKFRLSSIGQGNHYKGNQKNASLIYDDTLSIISSNYGRSMVDGKVNGFMEGEFEDEEPLYDDVLNLLLPDSDSGVDTEDSPPPPLPTQGPPVHLSPRVSMELQALNFPLFPSSPAEKSMLRKSTENLQKTLDGHLNALDNSVGGDIQKNYNLCLNQIRSEGRGAESHGDDFQGSHNVKDEAGAQDSTSGSGLGHEDKVLDRTRSLLNELSEKLNKLNFASPEYQTYISKVIVSSSPESSGVEEDYSSEKNCSLSNSNETTGRLTAVSKLVTETISMARGKFLDSMKMNTNNNSSSGPNLLTTKNKNSAGSGVVPPQNTDTIEDLEEPIYEEIGDMKRPSSPIYTDTFDVKSIFDGASRNEILSFLESLRDRLATAESIEEHL